MSNATEKAQMLMIKGVISDLSETDQAVTKGLIAKFTELFEKQPSPGNACVGIRGVGCES